MVEIVINKLNTIIPILPFLTISKDGKPHLNTARLTETIITVILTAIMTSYVTIQTMKVELNIMKEEQKIVRESLEDVKKDLYILKGKVEK